jgi:L-lactate dehydrogenase complex protein LldG
MTARDEVLSRIRAALGPELARQRPRPRPTGDVKRGYRVATDDGLDTFLDRLAHYEAIAHVVGESELAQTVRDILQGRRMIVPAGIPDAWTHDIDSLTDDPPLDHDALDEADGVVTTCALAIAQTGTVVLDGGPGMGRRALTLVPDYHLCIVNLEQIVTSVPEAIQSLKHPTRPLTFISGPSATVDIEMVRVKGVHGPRRLEVIVVATASSDRET